MSMFPAKFLWPELLNTLQQLSDLELFDLVTLISKMVVLEDPGLWIPDLLSLYAQREILISEAGKAETIHLTMQQLIPIEETVKG